MTDFADLNLGTDDFADLESSDEECECIYASETDCGTYTLMECSSCGRQWKQTRAVLDDDEGHHDAWWRTLDAMERAARG